MREKQAGKIGRPVIRQRRQFARNKQSGVLPPAVEIIGCTAVEAMLLEAACAPAPGLVDRFNAGAHRDMDIFLFLQSSSALAPAMYRCALAAWSHRGACSELMPVLRRIGVSYEQRMYEATGGVNTQKGLLFLLGVFTAATALTAKARATGVVIEQIIEAAAALCQGIVQRDLHVLRERLPSRQLTAGERLYLACGATGIRGEIKNGLPAVVKQGLPVLRRALGDGLPLNDALIQTLLALMTTVEDTTIINRHDPSVLRVVQADAARVLENGGMYTASGRTGVARLDQRYSERNISPGGSADLLAITYFLHAVAERLKQVD